MVCWIFSDSLEIGSCGEGLLGLWNMKQKVVWLLNLQYQVWEIWEKCTHIHLENLVWNHLCVCQTEVFLQWKYLLRKKETLKVFISMQSIPSPCPKCGFCSFWPNWQSSHWAAQLHDWVLSGSKSRSCGDNDPNVLERNLYHGRFCSIIRLLLLLLVHVAALSSVRKASHGKLLSLTHV